MIGRGPEVDRTVQILCRRSKNNPLYVGDPGVGKTAIAEGLARKIVEGDVPEVLKPAVYEVTGGRPSSHIRVRIPAVVRANANASSQNALRRRISGQISH